jgi:tRNA (mo5U34)-methyltransferase
MVSDGDLLERASRRRWYHTLELAPGTWTEGWFDLRDAIPHYRLPADMTGMRALDIGTWDGFWAFEMERRGASVVAIDLDDERLLDTPARLRPATYADDRGAGFALAKAIRSSRAERIVCSVYDARPAELGTFDFVMCGSVITHLRDQLLALERIRGLCKDTATFVNAEVVDRRLDLVPWPVALFRGHRDPVTYWRPNVRGWKRMLYAAGFEQTELVARFGMQSTGGQVPHAVFHSRRPI